MLRDIGCQATHLPHVQVGRNVIAVVGIDRYERWQGLNNAVTDARGALHAFVRLGFEPVLCLYDQAATADAMRRMVSDDLARLHDCDNLVLFFAGHGHTVTREFQEGDSQKTGYLIPVDGDRPGVSSARWLRLDHWLSDLARLPVKHLLVFVDACHSGIALGYLVKGWDTDRGNEPLAQLASRRSRRVITSALDDQCAMDSGPVPHHSLFTGCLIEGLNGGIAPHGVFVTGSQLGLYLQDRVLSYPGSNQTPDFGAFEEDQRGELFIKVLAGHQAEIHSKSDASLRNTIDRFAAGLALVVGIANYKQMSPLSRTVLNDAKDICEQLRSSSCGYLGEQVRELLDGQASLDQLRDGLGWLARIAGDEATVFIYFSGHGGRVNGASYLLPYDCDPNGLSNTSLSCDELSNALRAIHARRLVLVLDCCYSGGAGELASTDTNGFIAGFTNPQLGALAHGAGRVIITSSRADERSIVRTGDRNSLFTRHFIEALRGSGSRPENSYVGVFDVFHYVSTMVPRFGPQHPIFKATDLENNFAISLYNGSKSKADPQARLTHTLHRFPPGPKVPNHWITRGIVTSYAHQLEDRARARLAVEQAAAIRLRADPDATYVDSIDVPFIEGGALSFWYGVFDEATKHGPRMVAALLLVLEETQMSQSVQTERQELLERLRTFR